MTRIGFKNNNNTISEILQNSENLESIKNVSISDNNLEMNEVLYSEEGSS
jgi:hypothetical protein